MKSDKICSSLVIVVILTAISWIVSCKHETDYSNLPVVCFNKQVLPIFIKNCAISGCHDGLGNQIALNNYTSIFKSVVAHNPDASPSYQAIISTRGKKKMPPVLPPLPIEDRTTIRVWIEQGADTTSNCGSK